VKYKYGLNTTLANATPDSEAGNASFYETYIYYRSALLKLND